MATCGGLVTRQAGRRQDTILPHSTYTESRKITHEKEDTMPFLIVFMLLFVGLGLVRIVAAGLLAGTVFARVPNILDKVLDYKGKHCACTFPFGRHP